MGGKAINHKIQNASQGLRTLEQIGTQPISVITELPECYLRKFFFCNKNPTEILYSHSEVSGLVLDRYIATLK